MKKTMLSGIKPTGELTLGNYIGALKQFVSYQDEYELYIFVANLHCITVSQDPIELRNNLRDLAAFYLACGLDPQKVTLFLQSDVMQHAQLGFILSCNSYLGELNRMTQYKDKARNTKDNGVNLTAGFYTYPTLMAADILIYDADFVPVGEDQKQHVELARDIATRINNKYGDLFKVPTPLIPKVGAKIMSLSDPTKKMSKSEESNKGCIYLLDDLKVTRKKIMGAVTDDFANVHYDTENQPGISNLMTIMSSLTGKTFQEIEREFAGKGYGDFKRAVADCVCDTIEDLQSKYHEIINSGILESTFVDGAKRVCVLAEKKLKEVQKKIGLEIF